MHTVDSFRKIIEYSHASFSNIVTIVPSTSKRLLFLNPLDSDDSFSQTNKNRTYPVGKRGGENAEYKNQCIL
jgi:hypothetical protein